jgi:hypothetical protein
MQGRDSRGNHADLLEFPPLDEHPANPVAAPQQGSGHIERWHRLPFVG